MARVFFRRIKKFSKHEFMCINQYKQKLENKLVKDKLVLQKNIKLHETEKAKELLKNIK
jgi:hypothetical protein